MIAGPCSLLEFVGRLLVTLGLGGTPQCRGGTIALVLTDVDLGKCLSIVSAGANDVSNTNG